MREGEKGARVRGRERERGAGAKNVPARRRMEERASRAAWGSKKAARGAPLLLLLLPMARGRRAVGKGNEGGDG